MPEHAIRVLDMTPRGHYADGKPIYPFGHSFPYVTTTTPARATTEEAYKDATEWCRGYEAADRMGNMAQALGVTQAKGGFVGVVSYFHSST